MVITLNFNNFIINIFKTFKNLILSAKANRILSNSITFKFYKKIIKFY